MTLHEVVISLAITGLTISGLVTGHVLANKRLLYAGSSQEVQNQGMARLAQVKVARWDLLANPPVDELVESNFPEEVVPIQALSGTTSTRYLTNRVSIKVVSDHPPIKELKVQSIWWFREGSAITNTYLTFRAPDQ